VKYLLGVLPLLLVAAAKQPSPKPGGSASTLNRLAMPIAQPLRLVASTDRQGANEDYATLAPKQTAEFAKLTGPITLVRLWFTGAPIELMSVSAVVDGKALPLRKQGKFAGWPKAPELGGAPDKSFWSYAPIAVVKSFKLVATNHSDQPAKFFYQIGYRQPTERRFVVGRAGTERTKNSSTNYSAGNYIEKLDGAGLIQSMNLSLDTTDVATLNRTMLRIQPGDVRGSGVQVPLGALVGGFSTPNVNSRLISVKQTGTTTDLTLRLPIPYREGLEIGISGADVRGIRVIHDHSGVPPYRLCARHVSVKSQRGKPLDLLDVKGEGNFVGLIFALEGTFQRSYAMLEGDEIIEVDGDPKLRMQGTGTEDTFNSSWYFPDQPFSLPFHGLMHKSKEPIRVSAYRWFIADAIPFKQRLRFLFEHGGRNNTDGIAYQAVMFWYQKP